MGRRKRLGWLALAAAVAAAAAWYAPEPASPPEIAAPASSHTTPQAAKALTVELPERDALGKPRGQVFVSRSWEPPRRSAPARATAVAAAPAPPTAPPMPYRVAGKVVNEGGAHIVLAKGDRIFWVSEGESLDGGYRVTSITPERVTLTYLPLDIQQHLAVVSNLGLESAPETRTASATVTDAARATVSGAAQLRFEGPKQVRAGSPFDVALRVTSGSAVRASPLQLSFDAQLVQPVDVRAGGFFAGGNFTYRVSPGGSIFVGASGKGAIPADAEFLVVTFKPIRESGTAEIKLSSLILQDVSGRAIVHDQPAAFRTSIVQ